jgi:hypothetical protein
MVLLHLRVGLNLYVIPKRASQELADTQKLLPPFKGEYLEGCAMPVPKVEHTRVNIKLQLCCTLALHEEEMTPILPLA